MKKKLVQNEVVNMQKKENYTEKALEKFFFSS